MSKRIDVDGVTSLLRQGAQLVDVLPEAVYDKVHIPGAISVPLEQLDRAALAQLDLDRPIVVYCFDQH